MALDGVDFQLYPGEVVAVVGDNGAGKSTFVKALNGVVSFDEGELLLGGERVRFESPSDALRQGIETVYQDLALAGDLSAADNIFLGREIFQPGILGRLRLLENRKMRTEAETLLKRLEIVLPSGSVPVCDLSGDQRQCVAIARAVAWAKRLLILDEPTAAPGVPQQRVVLDLIRRVRSDHVPVILVSHNMHDVFEIADRIVVFRRSRNVETFKTGECTLEDVVGTIMGARA